MTVTFSKTVHFAFDGVTVNKYEVGKTYRSRNAHEARMFGHYVEKGDAYEGAQVEAMETETKVVRPKSKK